MLAEHAGRTFFVVFADETQHFAVLEEDLLTGNRADFVLLVVAQYVGRDDEQ